MKTTIGFLVLTATALSGIASAQHPDEHNHHGFYDYSTRRYYDYAYGSRSHLERMANQLWNAANAVCWEAHNNYRHEHGYHETYAEMYKMLKDSEHLKRLIHDAEYHPTAGITDHIASDLHELDELMHHVQDDVRRWQRDLHHHYDRYHSDHNHSVDRVYGRGDINDKLYRLEHTVHHLMEDYGVKSRIQAPAPVGGPGDPPPPVPYKSPNNPPLVLP
jgi:hypothetical protein